MGVLKKLFNGKVIKSVLGGVALATAATPAAARDYIDLPEVSDSVLHSDLSNIWQGIVESARFERPAIGPPTAEQLEFDPENDYLEINAGFGGGQYADDVERSANQYIQNGVDHRLVISALKAAQDVGVDFMFLMKTIEIECSFDFERYPKSSSARGPGILQGTWEDLARKHGDEWGFDATTDRKDLYWGSLGAALYIRDSVDFIRKYRPDGEIEPQMVRGSYFWGDGGNRKVLRLLDRSPDAPARRMLAAEYRANPTIVRGTVRQTYETVGKKVSDLDRFYDRPPITRFAAKPQSQIMGEIMLADLQTQMAPIKVEGRTNLIAEYPRHNSTQQTGMRMETHYRPSKSTGRIQF